MLTLAPPPFCFTPSLYHSMGGRALGIALFKLIPQYQIIGPIVGRVCILVGSTATVVFDSRTSLLFCEIAVEIEIAKKVVGVARKTDI